MIDSQLVMPNTSCNHKQHQPLSYVSIVISIKKRVVDPVETLDLSTTGNSATLPSQSSQGPEFG